MYVSHFFVSLVATTSAIDILGYRNNEKCSGGDYISCQNANPGECCIRASGNVFRSIGFFSIPSN
ncbi:hypothetical protein LZ30DRAFT_741409 [Colletotrichum cereale]|nr:hypothetical protein LZ30DRAFT_741409 [Colletotrichum cereale]